MTIAPYRWWWLYLMLSYDKIIRKAELVWMSVCVCLLRPVPDSMSSLLHLRNRPRQPLPASMPETLPDPTMPGSSAVLMPVSTATGHRAHSRLHSHAEAESLTHMWRQCKCRLHVNFVLVRDVFHHYLNGLAQFVRKESTTGFRIYTIL